ncbi:hypothetical protein L3Q82_008351 [Scortum barcoo]|uniref:Uncharacterized protein n=1 Tax=Scortum barcoo TaxID=214431 RepID=A0ACB8WH08_9TELE|nr:hypothetical protein L3Q82_008351 [Scortum barcoo]
MAMTSQAPIPKARLYSISGPERKAMDEYIEASLRSRTSSMSRQRKQNYNVGNWELLAIKVALEGVEQLFIVWTDHKNLQYLRTARLNS